MKAFIALELPTKIKKEIGKIQKQLRRAGVKATWARPEIAHLTLVFLGSITPNKVEPIGRILNEAAAQIKPTKVILHQVGCFPSPARPRVVFVGLQGELGKLNALSVKIRKRLKKEKIWFDEKPFRPHITLGRIRKRQNLTSMIKGVKVKRIEFIIDKVTLNQSILTPSGPNYQSLKSFNLRHMKSVGISKDRKPTVSAAD